MPLPALSPDLNPIEHLWNEIQRRTELDAFFLWVAARIPLINLLIYSRYRRCVSVINTNGEHTRHCLSFLFSSKPVIIVEKVICYFNLCDTSSVVQYIANINIFQKILGTKLFTFYLQFSLWCFVNYCLLFRMFQFFYFKYFIDKSIGLDNRLCLCKSSPTTRWNNLNTIYIRHRAIYPSCIHAIHLNYQA